MTLLEDSSTDIVLTLKKHPRHSKVFGQIYIAPYPLPNKKKASYPYRYFDQLASFGRIDLWSIPNFKFPVKK